MTGPQHPLTLETQGWDALSTNGEAAVAFYDRVLAEDVVMLLPGGLRLSDRTEILRSMGGEPWASYELDDPAALDVGDSSVLVHYGVRAVRPGGREYSALMSSLYTRAPAAPDGWLLVAHQ